MIETLPVLIGFDSRERDAWDVCRRSLIRRSSIPLHVQPLAERAVRADRLYTRPHEIRDGKLWCPISQAPMSTEFALTRFLMPFLVRSGWALFVDCDFLFVGDVADMMATADSSKAVMVVRREHIPADAVKMDGQVQTAYPRKNWSSLVLWNCSHEANRRLTLDMVNTLPGRDLHAFCWLQDDEIGALDPAWNFLVGHDRPTARVKAVHYTSGIPSMDGHEDVDFAEDWRRELLMVSADREAHLRTVRGVRDGQTGMAA